MTAPHSTSLTQRTMRRWRYRSALHAARAIHAAGSFGRRESTMLVPVVPRPRAAADSRTRDGGR